MPLSSLTRLGEGCCFAFSVLWERSCFMVAVDVENDWKLKGRDVARSDMVEYANSKLRIGGL